MLEHCREVDSVPGQRRGRVDTVFQIREKNLPGNNRELDHLQVLPEFPSILEGLQKNIKCCEKDFLQLFCKFFDSSLCTFSKLWAEDNSLTFHSFNTMF